MARLIEERCGRHGAPDDDNKQTKNPSAELAAGSKNEAGAPNQRGPFGAGSSGTVSTLPQFVIEREVPGAGSLSEMQIREISLRSLETLKDMGPQIQWLHSYVTEDKVYCLYLAPDENSVREHARRAG